MRLIDADVLREEVSSWGMNDYEPSDFTDAIDDAPTVEAILKADIVAILEEIQLEIEELKSYESADGQDLVMLADIGILFQQKINALKGDPHD